MANTIKLKRGTSTPTTSNISNGEVAIDTSAKKLYVNDSGTVKEIGGSGSVGGASGIDFNDSVKVRFGTGNDLELFHDGTGSQVNNSTSYLVIQSDDLRLRDKANGHPYLKAVADGSVELYHDNTKRFETTSSGAKVTGQLGVGAAPTGAFKLYAEGGDSDEGLFIHTGSSSSQWLIRAENNAGTQQFILKADGEASFAGDVNLADSKKIKLGAGTDLQIYSDGTDSIIKSRAGNALGFHAATAWFRNAANDETTAKFIENGAVELYYDNAKKLDTFSQGVNFYGSISGDDGDEVRLGTGNDMILRHNGSNSFIENSTGNLILRPKTDEEGLVLRADGASELYYDNSKKFETTNLGTTIVGDLWLDNPDTAGRDIQFDSSADKLKFDDNVKANFGSGDDLSIYHDGSNSYISDQGTGELRLLADIFHVKNAANDETLILGGQNGAVSLYYDNSKKFETNSEGVQIHGKTYAEGSIDMPDDAKLLIGNGDDLEIYHDGSNSYIKDAGTGALRFFTNEFAVYNADGSEWLFKAAADGAGSLYFNGSKHFETTSAGVTVTGTCNVTSHLNMTTADNQKIYLGQSNDLQIFHDGSNNYLRGYTAGQALYIDSLQDIRLRAGDNAGSYQNSIYMDNNGGVHCYYDNSKKFETYSSGCIFQGNIKADQDNATLVLGASSDFQLYHDGSQSRIQNNTGQLCLNSDEFGVANYGFTENIIRGTYNGNVRLYYDGSNKFETRSDGVEINGHLTMGDSEAIYLGASNDFTLWHDGTNCRIRFNHGVGDLKFQKYDNSDALIIKSDGDIEIPSDSARLQLGAGNDLAIYHNGSTNIIEGTNTTLSLRPKTGENGVLIVADSSTSLYFDDSKKIETTGSGVNLTSGHLYPNSDNTHDLGTAGNRWRSIYTSARVAINHSTQLVNESGLTVNSGGNTCCFRATGAAGHNPLMLWNNHTSGTRSQIQFADGSSYSARGSITTNGSNTSFNTSSDYRLKQDDVLITDGLAKVNALKPKRFKWKDNLSIGICDGFFAHEVQEAAPTSGATIGTKDEVDDDGNPVYQSIDQSKLIPLLTAAIQELSAEINTLKTKVTALEAA